MTRNTNRTLDAALILRDSYAQTATGVSQVGGSARTLDLGSGRVDSRVILDVDAIDASSGDEAYTLTLEGSNSSTFASGIVALASTVLGDSSVNLGSADDAVGRYEMPFTNEQNGTIYRYVRLNVTIAGTTPSLTARAFVAKN